ncbi:MAG TPA: hypothetical protein VLG46_06595 [Anaerolineae bacterium]|nr:hypothetical protein [Anaerolineae bacterium]
MMLNLKPIGAGLLCSILLAACGGAHATPIVPPTAASTAVPVSTQLQASATLAPTITPLPTQESAAPETTQTASPAAPPRGPQINHAQPLFIFPTTDGLMIVNADGTGKTLISDSVPTLGRNLSVGLSPRGGLLAFYAGVSPRQAGSEPLTLKLLDVSTGKTQSITRLFSLEMEQALQTASAPGERTDAVEASIAVVDNDHTLAWSPDGRYLAFIAAIDGPSSDLYSYDRETGQVNRLTDGLNQAARLFWSPDSQWIIHEEVISFGTGAGWNVKAVWAAAPDGSGNRKLYDVEHSGDEIFVDWVTPKSFRVYSWTPIGLRNIRLVDLDTGAAQRSGPEFPVQALAVDPKSQAQLYVVDDYAAKQNDLQGGLYLASPAKQPQLIASGNWYDVRWLPHAQLFFAKGEKGVISVKEDGTTTEYFGEGALPIDAPDGAWLLAWGEGNYTSPIGLRLYTTDGAPAGELKRAITTEATFFATWAPDSTGVFYVSGGALRYASIPNGEPQLIEENLTTAETGSMGWVMP